MGSLAILKEDLERTADIILGCSIASDNKAFVALLDRIEGHVDYIEEELEKDITNGNTNNQSTKENT